MSRTSIPRLLILGVFLASRLEADSFRFGDQTLTAPEGFTIELAAGPPLVDRPIAADFDDEGRLYATDSSGSSDKVEKQLAERPHRIVRLEDADGDGRYDRSTVFADRMMFPEGILWFDGSVYCAAPPAIWKLTDRDGDGVAEEREVWFDGKTLTGCANDLHGPYLGPDGWIYWCKGAFAEQRHERPGRPPFVTRASHIFRARPDGSGIEPVLTGGMDNPVDVAFTAEGERMLSSTFLQHPGGGRRDGLIHALYGGVYGKEHHVLDSHARTGDLLPAMTHLGPAAPCGLTRYSGRAFGSDCEGSLFATLFNLHKVTRHDLVAEGATFRTRDSDLVVSTSTDFHPTDVLEDADGSLLVVDTGGWYKLCCPTSQLAKPDVLGAIYRVRRAGTAPPPDPRGRELPWEATGPEALVSLLADERPAVRSHATARLAALGEAAVPALAAALASGSTPARQGAVWALCRIPGEPARRAGRAALADREGQVRQTAAHAASVWRDAGAVPLLLDCLREGEPPLRRAAAEALGRIGDRAAVPALLAAASGSPAAGPPGTTGDRALEHSLIYALIEIGDREATAAGLAAGAAVPPAPARRAALLALDQMPGGGLRAEDIAPLLGAAEPAVRDAAVWIAGRHPEWAGALLGHLRREIEALASGDPRLEDVARRVALFASDRAVQDLLSAAVAPGKVGSGARLAALRVMALARLKETPSAWSAAVASLLDARDAGLLRPALAAARSLARPGGTPELRAALLALARDEAVPAETRLDALAALPDGLEATETALFAFLRARLRPEEPVLARAAAASVLARSKLPPGELIALADVIGGASAFEAARLLPAFAQAPEEEVGLHLLAALKDSAALAGVRPEVLKPLLEKFPAAVRKRGVEVLALLEADPARDRAHLEELLAALEGGDVRRGQAVFNSQKAGCASCHAIGYLGGTLGPDLTRIGQIRTERDLLEAIAYPSASFVQSYEPTVVVTRRGEVQSGILRGETADEVVLATGPDAQARIPRADIAEMSPGSVSLMPQGLEAQLTRQELADLVAFLRATRW